MSDTTDKLCERLLLPHHMRDADYARCPESISETVKLMRAERREAAAELTRLTTELEGAREAVTPSGDTKAAYHGEFKFDVPLDGYDEDGEALEGFKSVYVPWDTVKQIMTAIRDRAALNERNSHE